MPLSEQTGSPRIGLIVWNAMVAFVNGLEQWLQRTAVDPREHGAVADGVADDAAALRDAAQVAVTRRVPLSLPADATIGLGSRVNLPAGLTVLANGATFQGLAATGDFLLAFAERTTVRGELRVQTAAGANVRGVSLASNTRVEALTIAAPSPGAGAGDLNDSALLILGASRVRIGELDVENLDFPVKVAVSSRVRIGDLQIRNYVRGLYVTDTKHLRVDGGLVSGVSPNESTTEPGHNGVLIDATVDDATTDLRFGGLVVRDAGEHGWRIGGARRVRRVRFDACAAVSVGGCGLKILGGTTADPNRHEDIWVSDFLVEDAGQTPENAAAVQLELVRRVQVDGLTVRRAGKTYSAGFGVQVQAAEDVTIDDALVDGTLVAAYAVRGVLGDSTNVRVNGGVFTAAAGDVFLLDYTGRTFRRVSIEGHPQADPSATGYALHGVNTDGTGAIVGGSWVTWQSVDPAERQVTGLLAGYFADVRAPFTGTPNFKPGSVWRDNATGELRTRQGAAGVWVRDTGFVVVVHGADLTVPRPDTTSVLWIGDDYPTAFDDARDILNGPAGLA